MHACDQRASQPELQAQECQFAVHGIHALDGARTRFGNQMPWHEVLIRPGARFGYSDPEQFVQALYSSQRPADVDRHIFQRCSAWLLERSSPTRISINVHPESLLDTRFLVEISERQRLAGARGHSVCLELVEFGGCSDKTRLIEHAQFLRAAGVLIALDDFGSRLNCFDLCAAGIVDVIKIDTAVVTSIDADPHQRAIVQCLETLATGLRAGLVAEGIESQAQFDAVQQLDVHFGQGYFLGRPEIVENI